jgi:hypothetical protein
MSSGDEAKDTVACLLGNAANTLLVLDLTLDLFDIPQSELESVITRVRILMA